MKNIYIILMNTGTIVSKLVKGVTRYKYSHVVLSLDDSYTKLYSFGRKKLHNVFKAGFVTYGIDSDFFKKFNETDCIIYEISITKKQYYNLQKTLKKFEKNMDEYHYDIKGLIIRIFYNNPKIRKNYYVCSQFVASVLIEARIYDFKKSASRVRPLDFTKMENAIEIYEGKFLKLNRY